MAIYNKRRTKDSRKDEYKDRKYTKEQTQVKVDKAREKRTR